MYVFYIQSFRFLAAHQVALFTIFTPLYVAAAADLLEKRFRPLHLWTALLAVAGTAVIVYSGLGSAGLLAGFVLVQASNLCFALGQVLYRRLAPAGQGMEGPRRLSPGSTWAGRRPPPWPCCCFRGPPRLDLDGGQCAGPALSRPAGFGGGIFPVERRRHQGLRRHCWPFSTTSRSRWPSWSRLFFSASERTSCAWPWAERSSSPALA